MSEGLRIIEVGLGNIPPSPLDRLMQAMATAIERVPVGSGFRSIETQQHLYRSWRDRPDRRGGHSLHAAGGACPNCGGPLIGGRCLSCGWQR